MSIFLLESTHLDILRHFPMQTIGDLAINKVVIRELVHHRPVYIRGHAIKAEDFGEGGVFLLDFFYLRLDDIYLILVLQVVIVVVVAVVIVRIVHDMASGNTTLVVTRIVECKVANLCVGCVGKMECKAVCFRQRCHTLHEHCIRFFQGRGLEASHFVLRREKAGQQRRCSVILASTIQTKFPGAKYMTKLHLLCLGWTG